MPAPAIAPVTKMMESLPEGAQDQLVDRVPGYVAEIADSLRWEGASAVAGTRSASQPRDRLRLG